MLKFVVIRFIHQMVLFHFLKDAQYDTALSLETRTCVHLVVDEPTGIE